MLTSVPRRSFLLRKVRDRDKKSYPQRPIERTVLDRFADVLGCDLDLARAALSVANAQGYVLL